MKKSATWRGTLALFVLGAAAAIVSQAQILTTLASFDGANGGNPSSMSLVQGFDGNFYGTAQGGLFGGGTVFKISPSGTLTTLYNFCPQTNCPDGSAPHSGLALTVDGNFYGITGAGGASNKGTVFKITPSGKLTTLYSFCIRTNCADGEIPVTGLVQATDGNFYGTTIEGGSGENCTGAIPCGTVFKITPSGSLSTLYSFCNQPSCADGAGPQGGLIEAVDGSLYGTTYEGGLGSGTIFKVTREGGLITLHNFDFADGALPYAGLIQGADRNFYGTASQGGYRHDYGTVYKITLAGTVKADTFDGGDGAVPVAGLIQATDGNLYGATRNGGSGAFSDCGPTGGCGTVFKLTPKGALTSLYSFCVQSGCPDGLAPAGGLVQGTDGNFYGTTSGGGANSNGTVFSLSLGLGPFVKTLPTSGRVGAAVIILGTDLTKATDVSFNGTPTSFAVVSSSEITTTVPTGATGGTVQVTTPSGTLLSNVRFQVKP